jgi:OTT_1508-like deaminase
LTNILLYTAHGPSSGEEEILLKIIRLDIKKIRQYLRDLRAANGVFDEPVAVVESRVLTALSNVTPPDPQVFLDWFRHIFVIRNLPDNPEPKVLADHIKWAQKAKRLHLSFLKAAFSNGAQSLPRWVLSILKLGRYSIASKSFVQLALEFPALVSPIVIEPVTAPPRTRFTFGEEDVPLTSVLKRVGCRADELVPRLAQIWNTTDAETHFRRACSLNLVAHAEIQLVNFYDHNPHWRPSFRFMGVSKKSCYLCHLFLTTHPDSFCVSSCHQKIYPSWIPPPAVNPKVYRQYKAMITKLSGAMEATAKNDLDSRLGIARRSAPAESTAGVSLSGLTGSSWARMSTRPLIDLGASGDDVSVVEPPSPPHPVEVVTLMPMNPEVDPFIGNDFLPEPTESFSGCRRSTSGMVLHFIRPDDISKQDIISISDIVDSSTGCPSWAMLVDFLKVGDNYGLAFNEAREYLMVNDRIRVSNERQLLACLRYLRNADVFNAEVFVRTINEATCSTLLAEEGPNENRPDNRRSAAGRRECIGTEMAIELGGSDISNERRGSLGLDIG